MFVYYTYENVFLTNYKFNLNLFTMNKDIKADKEIQSFNVQ